MPSNMSIQTTSEPSYMDRPSMQEDDHPDHNMPAPEHDGTVTTRINNAMKDIRKMKQGDSAVSSDGL